MTSVGKPISTKNGLLRLDILEHGAFEKPFRYRKTKDIVFSLKRKNQLPNKESATEEILQLKKLIIEKKLHHCVSNLYKSLKKAKKSEVLRIKNKLKGKDLKNTPILEKELELLNESIFRDDSVLETLAYQKAMKLLEKIFKLKKTIPEWMPSWVAEAFNEKDNKYNSSKFYRQSDNDTRRILSNLYNHKFVSEMIKECEVSLKIVDGHVPKTEVLASKKSKLSRKESNDSDGESESENESESDDESDYDGEIESKDRKNVINLEDSGRRRDFEIEGSDDEFAEFDNLVGASDADSDEENNDESNDSINYNEVTDDEPSDEDKEEELDDFFEFASKEEERDKKKKKEKVVLPSLQAGYYSGGSDDEEDFEKASNNDEILNNLDKPRKNRRGQRARQKIWEKKFGKKANHVQKEQVRAQNERERKQSEYEERVRKRAEKQKVLEESEKNNPNKTPLGVRKVEKPPQPMHPSWVAKRKAEQQLGKVEFSGKKIKFD